MRTSAQARHRAHATPWKRPGWKRQEAARPSSLARLVCPAGLLKARVAHLGGERGLGLEGPDAHRIRSWLNLTGRQPVQVALVICACRREGGAVPLPSGGGCWGRASGRAAAVHAPCKHRAALVQWLGVTRAAPTSGESTGCRPCMEEGLSKQSNPRRPPHHSRRTCMEWLEVVAGVLHVRELYLGLDGLELGVRHEALGIPIPADPPLLRAGLHCVFGQDLGQEGRTCS